MNELDREPSLFFIVKQDSDTRDFQSPPQNNIDLAFKWFGEWFNEFVAALKYNNDYEKYAEYLIELLKIAYTIRKIAECSR